MEPLPETKTKKTDLTPFHFTLTRSGVRLDIAFKQRLGHWRISHDGTTLASRHTRPNALRLGYELLGKVIAKESETAAHGVSAATTQPETKPVMELVFSKAERMANGDKRVFVYSKATGSALGYIWKIGACNWQTDHNLNVALGLAHSVFNSNLPSLRKRLKAWVANQ